MVQSHNPHALDTGTKKTHRTYPYTRLVFTALLQQTPRCYQLLATVALQQHNSSMCAHTHSRSTAHTCTHLSQLLLVLLLLLL
jgi:hypothetical protein